MLRRTLLQSLSVAASAAFASSAHGARRARYGGAPRLVLPLGLTRIDPHDPEDLTAALLSENVFEPLFSRAGSSVYATLAAGLPEKAPGGVSIELRPHLSFASGRSLSPLEVVESLKRAQRTFPPLARLGRVRLLKDGKIFVAHPDPIRVATCLSFPQTALLPRDFTPQKPDASGAFAVKSSGSRLVLERNSRAPRGGSFLERVTVEGASLPDCLRAFEAKGSDVGWLGAGLHQPRKDAVPFSRGTLGLLVLRAGKGLSSYARPGQLNEALSRIPAAPLQALGVERTSRAVARYTGPPMELLIEDGQPWLSAIAEEIRAAWSEPKRLVTIRSLGKAELSRRLRGDDFDAALTFLRTEHLERGDVSARLFEWDGKQAPRSGRALEPTEAARQLGLGVLGELKPRGYFSSSLRGVSGTTGLNLADAELLR